MQQNLPHQLEKSIVLPFIDRIDRTELAFSHAFLQAAYTLHNYLQEIQFSIARVLDSNTEPQTVAIIGLFSKTIRSYYSYVLLEIHGDRVRSQSVIEELWDTAVTLIYLLATPEPEIFNDYVAVSMCQARILLQEIETQLQQFPHALELLVLRERLEAFVAKKQPATDRQPSNSVTFWGKEAENTTAKRATLLGLNFLSNPARQIVQKIAPASFLDVQLNYVNSAASGLQASKQKIDFQQLRDASHLCLHAAMALLEEFVQLSAGSQSEIQQQQQLNVFFEWFYQAYQAYSCGSDASPKSNKNRGRH